MTSFEPETCRGDGKHKIPILISSGLIMIKRSSKTKNSVEIFTFPSIL